MVGHRLQALQHIAAISERVFAVPLAGDHDRVEDGRAQAGVGMVDEQPVFLSDGRRSDRVFNQVGVEPGLTVAQLRGQRDPVTEQIDAGLTEKRLGQRTFSQPLGDAVQPSERAGKPRRAQRRTLGRGHARPKIRTT